MEGEVQVDGRAQRLIFSLTRRLMESGFETGDYTGDGTGRHFAPGFTAQ